MKRAGIASLAAVLVMGMCTALYAGGECCDKAMKENAWCDKCKHGFVAGISMDNKKLYDALAGKAIDKAKLTCDGCKKVASDGGVCDKCHVGVIKGKAYPMAAYALLIGEPCKPESELKCDGCKKNLKSGGWCDACKCGIVGKMRYSDKAKYEAAEKAAKLISEAAKAKCDGCAVAMVTDGTCAQCKVTYKDGKAAKEANPAE